MAEPLFSEREGLVPRPDLQADDYLPTWVREAVTNEVRDFVQNKPSAQLPTLAIYLLFRPYISKVLRREPPGVGHGQVGPPAVGVAEATWVLATMAATILYFVCKFPE